jgi:hypothetical protein
MLFSSIPGLRETKEKLVTAIRNNHLAHALLFHGPEGSANLTWPWPWPPMSIVRTPRMKMPVEHVIHA